MHPLGDLAEKDLHVLRLHDEHQDVGPVGRFRVGERRRDAVSLGELGGALLATRRHHDLVRVPAAGADQPGNERLPHLAAAQEGDLASGHRPLLKRFDRKNHTFAGRSASRRVRYGYHSIPYGT